MIELLDLEKVTRNLTPITSIEYTIGKSQALHPEGLFSETIFGMQNSPDRNKTYSYINLYCKVFHPALMNVFYRLNRKILSVIKKEKIFSIDKDGHLIENEKGNINGLVRLIANFDKIKFQDNDNLQRSDLIKMVNYYNKKGLVFINKILVIPAGYRDAVIDPVSGGLRIDPLNEYYVKILRSANQLQAIQSGEIYDVLSSKMNDLVLELYEFLGDKLGKKEGLIRDKILARRSDFTARAVIVGGSTEIKVNQIGVPFRVLLKLFEPFIIYDLVNSGNVTQSELSVALREYNNSTLSIPVLRNLMNGIHGGDELTPNLERIMKDSVQRVIKDKVVIAKRDPALQTENAQGFYPVMIDGTAVKLNVLKCSSFNADFDGDSFFGNIRIRIGSKKKKQKIWMGDISKLENVEI